MSVYDPDDERTIRAGRRAHDWMKSGLLSAAQYERIKPELQVDLRRTNLFLRLVLFVFSMMILQSVIGLVVISTGIREGTAAAILCVGAGVTLFWLAGYLIERFRFYRFGIEEAAAVAAINLLAGGAALAWSTIADGTDGLVTAALISGTVVALAVFFRFGYLYAALAAVGCAAGLPFVLVDSEIIQRLIAIAILAAIAAAAWMKRSEYGNEHPGDTYGLIEAAGWIGIYFVINLQLFTGINRGTWFYWATYAGVWIVPLLGLWLSIRSRHRMLLDVSLLMLLLTLMMNKEYLGSPRHSWDPIVFGLVLMGGAIAIRRWLAGGDNGERDGFTATRILASDKSGVAVLGTLASLAHPGTPEAQPAAAADPIGGGGRSGGAGATGSF